MSMKIVKFPVQPFMRFLGTHTHYNSLNNKVKLKKTNAQYENVYFHKNDDSNITLRE